MTGTALSRRPAALSTDRVVVVGAGIAGLAATLRLAAAGVEVELIEAASHVGGKMRTIPSAAGPVDAGPTVLTMRGVFEELFAAAGARLDDHVALEPLPVLARHYWPDGSALDLHADRAASEAAVADFAGGDAAAAFAAFSDQARLLFETFEGPVMRAARPTPLSVGRAVLSDAARLLPAMAPGRSLWSALLRRFRDPRLVQLFARYATYVGGSPFLSPAMLLLIWRAEEAGVWRPIGGMSALARAVAALAEARGARIRLSAPVAEIEIAAGRAAGLRLACGERIAARAVLFAGDPSALGEGLLGPGARRAARATPPARRSLSANVWTFAGRPSGVPLQHHTVFFGPDSRAEFDDCFARRRAPGAPTVYVCAEDRDGAGRPSAPLERFEMIVNAPAADGPGPAPPEEIDRCRMTTFARLSASGLDLTPPTERRALTTPRDFAGLFPGTGGALYGANPHGALATFARPVARSRIPGLYLAGGGTHPGPGVPMAALSGALAVEAIMRDRVSTYRSIPTATPGGMSTGSPIAGATASPSSPSSAPSSPPITAGPAAAAR